MTKKPEDSGYKIESNQENRQHLKCFRSVLATSHKTNYRSLAVWFSYSRLAFFLQLRNIQTRFKHSRNLSRVNGFPKSWFDLSPKIPVRVKGGMSLRNDIIMRKERNSTGKHARVSAALFLTTI